MTLQEPIKFRNVYQQECKIEGFVLESKVYVAGENKGRLHTNHYCFGTNGKGKSCDPLMESTKLYKKSQNPDDGIENQLSTVWAKDHLFKLGSIYFLDIQNLQTFFKTSGFGPLGRLFQIYKEDFQTAVNVYTYTQDNQQHSLPTKQALRQTDIKN